MENTRTHAEHTPGQSVHSPEADLLPVAPDGSLGPRVLPRAASLPTAVLALATPALAGEFLQERT